MILNPYDEPLELLRMEKGRAEVERDECLAASHDKAEDYETLDNLAGYIEGLATAIEQLETFRCRINGPDDGSTL